MILFGSYLPDFLNDTSNAFPVPVLTSIGSLVNLNLGLVQHKRCYIFFKHSSSLYHFETITIALKSNAHVIFLIQDGLTITYARREAKESESAESSNADNVGKYPVLVVEGANHGQVASGIHSFIKCSLQEQ